MFSNSAKCQHLTTSIPCAFAHFILNQLVDIVTTQLNKAPQNSKAGQMPKLTQKFVNTVLHPDKGQIIFRDTVLAGFGLRVTPGSKTYVVEARVHGVCTRMRLFAAANWAPQQRLLGIARRKEIGSPQALSLPSNFDGRVDNNFMDSSSSENSF
jgi:hypothetical protein